MLLTIMPEKKEKIVHFSDAFQSWTLLVLHEQKNHIGRGEWMDVDGERRRLTATTKWSNEILKRDLRIVDDGICVIIAIWLHMSTEALDGDFRFDFLPPIWFHSMSSLVSNVYVFLAVHILFDLLLLSSTVVVFFLFYFIHIWRVSDITNQWFLILIWFRLFLLLTGPSRVDQKISQSLSLKLFSHRRRLFSNITISHRGTWSERLGLKSVSNTRDKTRPLCNDFL